MKIGDRAKIRLKQLVGSPLAGYQDYQMKDVYIWGTVTQMGGGSFTVKYDKPQDGYEYQAFPLPIPDHVQIIRSALKLIIYTRFPEVIADLLESHYKRIVIPEAADLLGPIEAGEERVTCSYAGGAMDDPIYAWMKWAMNCGLISSYKVMKVE